MRSLRIGVVIAGQLVEERVFSGAVTFGQALRCAISLPLDGLPREHLLFARDEGAFVLRPAKGMLARVAIGGEVQDVGETRLPPGARGKLAIGDATILFQEILQVVRPKPRLPASLRAHHFDRRLATIIAASLVVHIGIAAWAWSGDLDTTVLGMRDVPLAFQHDTIDVQLPDHVERIDPTTIGPAVATPVTPTHHLVQPVVSRPSDPDRLAEDASRMASILTGDDGTHGFGGMNHRQPGADLARQMDDAANRVVTIGDNGHTSRVDDRARIGTDRGLQIHDPTIETTPIPAHVEHEGRIVIKPLPGGGDDSTLTAQMVLEKIGTAYIAGLQRCYRLGQNEDAGLEGKVAIELTVDEHGRVTEPSASGLTDQVDKCIGGFMGSWHFGIPKDKDGQATQATFKIALVLKKS
ncbi:MAG: hypothetical protein ABI591_16995 [Kofleriaceae bacterium]